ncbi:Dirigent protein [Thalictrum thalictroides]|uniref:Dirigent protein n=1 Tax=Thalictrum thalictroides TaxID=46969 RepID=A0A7J6VXG9_THATH|nr:Dirigent protein [Thalictrum thalictroides]
MKEKVSHLHFYFHDTVSGKNPTVIRIAGPKDTGFGTTRVADDPLTEGPDPKSKLIGKAQGMFAVSAQQELSLIMMLSYAFTAGKYNGSTLSILGRNSILHPIREMPIVGGTGLFRFARGYALARTVSFDTTLEDAVVEYNVTVIHY